jgi:RecB family endonuclease NucS
MRLVIATCSVDYAGRLSAHLPLATRVIMVKGDGSVLIHSDGGSYKPLNWMPPPCSLEVLTPDAEQVEAGVIETWKVLHHKTSDLLMVNIHEIHSDHSHHLGVDPGLIKDGVEADLQKLLATDSHSAHVAIEIKRRGDIDGVEQLTRYLELLNRDPHLAPVTGVYAAQEIKPQARTLAEDRGIRCLVLDYDQMRGIDDHHQRLF